MRTLPVVLALGFACRPAAPPAEIHFELAAGVDPSGILALGSAAVEPVFRRPVDELQADRASAIAEVDGPVPDLTRWYQVSVPTGDADELLAALALDPSVVTAFVAPVPELASAVVPAADGDSCPIKTPSFETYQGYLAPAPGGIDVGAARTHRGGLGEGVWFADVEGGWNTAHEDLPAARMEHVAGRPIADRGWIAHGTAVLGEVAGRDNGLGVTGIAPGIERIFTASIGGLSAAAAIDAAQARLRPGDVLLIELHAPGPRGYYLPMEYWEDVFQAIRVATARGVVVIEAAGNGAEDLDHPAYRGRLTRGSRDSGAILVGAGAPLRDGWTDRSRLDFSNYGSRVDVQGWGRRVATLDYGDLQDCTEKGERNYTDKFGGTSSASPVVAGAAVLIESVARAERGQVLRPDRLRALLGATGSPQTDGPSGPVGQRIGPRPDLARALTWPDD